MSDANKAVVRRIYEEVFDKGRLEVVDEIVSPDAVDHSPPPVSTGNVPEDLKGFANGVRQAVPDAHFTVGEMVAEGDLVCAHWTMEGTHENDFFGLPASGQRVTVSGIDLIAVVDGRCVEHWGYDNIAMQMMPGGPPPA